MTKDLNYYLSLPYSYTIEWSDVNNCFLGSIVELEKNITCGNTPEEVIANLKEALVAYIDTSLANNLEIPEPVKAIDCKGKISYRTTAEQHYKIAKRAKSLNMSINAFIDQAVTEKLQNIA